MIIDQKPRDHNFINSTQHTQQNIQNNQGKNKIYIDLTSSEPPNNSIQKTQHQDILLPPPQQMLSLKRQKSNTQRQSHERLQIKQTHIDRVEQQKSARQILKQLEQVLRKKSIEKKQQSLHKSLQIQRRFHKLDSQKTIKKKETKKKEAEQKLKVSLEFLQSLKLKPKQQKLLFKQFRSDSQFFQSPSKRFKLKIINNIDVGSRNFGSIIRYSTNQVSPKIDKKIERSLNNMNILIESPLKLPPIDLKHSIKPKPYSIYSIYQKKNQLFTNIPSINHW